MTAKEIQKRNQKAEQLKVLQSDDGQYFVESSEGKILYNVIISDAGDSCTCGDYARNVKKSPDFKCKHILAVYNAIPQKQVEGATFLERQAPKLDERWITKIEGKEFVKYPGLLDLGHQKGISSIEVEIVQMPTGDNGHFAVCRATVMSKLGETYSDIGDANPSNCSSKVSKHLLRMASTRAIARALRSYTNVGMTALEELADINEAINEGGSHEHPKAQSRPAKKAPSKAPRKSAPEDDQPKSDAEPVAPAMENQDAKESVRKDDAKSPARAGMSEAQRRAIFNLSRRRGISVEEIECMIEESYGVTLDNLTSSDASAFIRQLQTAA